MFHFIIPLIKGRLIGAVINRILPRLFPIVLGILKKQQSKKQNQSFSDKQKVTIDVQAREKKQSFRVYSWLTFVSLEIFLID